ncbi:MAG: lasso peptide biosynthesis B2 protein [Chloracidobacterium sp.]|nr:lasso peptide biosynthesis B2 protein [Chloracidobacterium sp.]MDW8217666.1 lasso peptide biosynthesis B2 protein [Acidobacteriota bacterium]
MQLKRRLRQLGTFWRLSPDDRAGLLVAWALLTAVDVLCRVIGVRCCLHCLQRMTARCSSVSPPEEWVMRQAELVGRAARHTLRPTTCLIRALALWFWLTRRGVTCEIVLGVQKTLGALEAHAWVEWQGRPLLEAADIRQHYAAFDQPLSSILLGVL